MKIPCKLKHLSGMRTIVPATLVVVNNSLIDFHLIIRMVLYDSINLKILSLYG